MKLNRVVIVICSELALLWWTLCCYRAPHATHGSGPWILNINVVFPVACTGALAIGSLLRSLLPFHICCYWIFVIKIMCITFSTFFSAFLKGNLMFSKKISLLLYLWIPAVTSPPLYAHLIGESRIENSWSPNIAWIQQAEEKHLTKLPLLSRIKMAGLFIKTL